MSELALHDSQWIEREAEEPLIGGDKSPADVTRDVCRPLERPATALWWSAFLVSATVLAIGVAAVWYEIATGIGTWGLNKTVGWAFDITNFVFWIGIGHAGTLISAILFLFRQKWRTSVNRSAEAMTLFAVICAAIFPLIHMGRPWFAYWVFPYPNTRGSLWVNFRSPLLWDVFAVSVYFTVSAVFWYLGLIPDLATIRERARGVRRRLFAFFSLGWNGSLRTWNRYELVYLLLAGLATPLVLSVHSIVSFDFATSLVPGWHTTIFPPYFVAGAIFSGMSMVLTLMIIARTVMPPLRDYITPRHIDAMAKLVLVTSGMVGLSYATEAFTAFYGGNRYEEFAVLNRAMGPFGWGYWIMVVCNVMAPQLYWWKRVRRNVAAVFVISILVNVGMWFERFIIIVTSLHRDYLPSSWATYRPTLIEIATLAGSFGLFFTAFLLFCRFLPMIAMAEVKAVLFDHHGEVAAPVGPASETPSGARAFALFFDDEDDLSRAVADLRRSGYAIADVQTPYAVHGLERLAGLPPSRLGWVCAIAGFAGAGLALLFEIWTSSSSWALDVGGKPFASIPAFIPIAFEIGVLCAALATVLALFVRGRLYPGKRVAALPRVEDDRFAVIVAAVDASFDRSFLERRYGRLTEVQG